MNSLKLEPRDRMIGEMQPYLLRSEFFRRVMEDHLHILTVEERWPDLVRAKQEITLSCR